MTELDGQGAREEDAARSYLEDSLLMQSNVIAIDGPVASGKTTVGRALAKRLGYRFLDTGLMYRAATLMALRRGVALDDPMALGSLAHALQIEIVPSTADAEERILVDGEDVTADLRSSRVEDAVSLVARVTEVRKAMVVQQQRMAAEGRIVMVGRDIGTKVVPTAAKVFLDATPNERARRRLEELKARGEKTTMAAVRANLDLRDQLDTERTDSPLMAAADAVHVKTEGLSPDDVVDRITRIVGAR